MEILDAVSVSYQPCPQPILTQISGQIVYQSQVELATQKTTEILHKQVQSRPSCKSVRVSEVKFNKP